MQPLLSVIVVSWNTRELLAQCLESLYQTIHVPYEVIVVDNASEDGSVDMVRQRFPQAQLIVNDHNAGFTGGNNQALGVCQGKYILLFNSDAVALPGAVDTLVNFAIVHPEAGIVGARLLNPDGSFQASFMDFPTLWSEFLMLSKLARVLKGSHYPSYPPQQSQETRLVDWVTGACLLVRREMVEEVGLLDESYVTYSEEVDWCWRARKAGWQVYYVAEASVLHWGGQSAAKMSSRRRGRVYASKALFFEKHRGRAYATVFRWLVWAVTGLKILSCLLGLVWPRPEVRRAARQNLQSYRFVVESV
ncbi:MAG: glycosyltransferase family 2 protein [Anaerolineae bacterium]|nr:glycosyltransferase family 2 protein [Anaerolineae bacterium]